MSSQNRIDFIDLAKGVCILMVVLGHTGVNVSLPGFTNMRMPFYFILSGIFFKTYGGLHNLLIKKINKILIPFWFFYITGYVIFYLLRYFAPTIQTGATGILDMFTQRQFFNGPIWFLLALFWVNIIWGIVVIYIQKEWARFIIVLCIGAFGATLAHYGVFTPCNLDSACSAMPFFYLGFLLKKYNVLVQSKCDKYNLLIALLFWSVAALIYFGGENARFSFHTNMLYGNWILALLAGAAGAMSILFICKSIGRLPFLSYFGRYSIIPLCLHHLIYRPIQLIVNQLNITWGGYVVAACTIIMCWACIPLCIKYLPHVTAQKECFKIKS